MTQWKRDERPENVRTIGDFTVYSETNSERETAHVIRLRDGRELRILPDDDSGHTRSHKVRKVCEFMAARSEALVGDLGYLVAIGALVDAELTWELAEDHLDLCESCGRPL